MQQYITNTESLLHSAAIVHGMRAGAAEAILNHEDRIYIMRMAKHEDKHLDPPGDTRKPAWGCVLPEVCYMKERQTLVLLKLKKKKEKLCMPSFPPFIKSIK